MRFEAREAMFWSLSYQNVVYKQTATQASKAYVCAAKLQLLKFEHARRDPKDFKKGFEFKADTAPSSSFRWFEWSS